MILASSWLMKAPMHTVPTTIHRYAPRRAMKGIAGGARPFSTASIDAALGNTVCAFTVRHGLRYRPTDGRLRRNLDRAGPGHCRGRPRAAAALRIVARAEVVKEDTSRAHDCDNYGCYHGYRFAAHLLVSPISCLTVGSGSERFRRSD